VAWEAGRMRPEDRLAELRLTLPAAPPTASGGYELAVRTGNLLFLAGHGPLRNGEVSYVGKLGRRFSLDDGRAAAELAACNMLATLIATLGELSRVRRVVKLFGMVNCTEDFERLPEVLDSASRVFVALWGDAGRHARSAVGMQQLPSGMAIEIEGVFELADG